MPREEFQPQVDLEPWLERLGLAPFKDKYPGQLSGGQRQRTAIARTLALKPDLLLMDEPFSSLDAPTRSGLQNLTLELWAEQSLTLVIVTHAIEEAAVLGQRILLLGAPPNRQPQVIENPARGPAGFPRHAGISARWCSACAASWRRTGEAPRPAAGNPGIVRALAARRHAAGQADPAHPAGSRCRRWSRSCCTATCWSTSWPACGGCSPAPPWRSRWPRRPGWCWANPNG